MGLLVSIRSPSEEGLKRFAPPKTKAGLRVSIRSPSEEGLKHLDPVRFHTISFWFQSAAPPKRG